MLHKFPTKSNCTSNGSTTISHAASRTIKVHHLHNELDNFLQRTTADITDIGTTNVSMISTPVESVVMDVDCMATIGKL